MSDLRVRPEELEFDIDVDPVCGELIEPEDAEARSLSIDYEGRQYVFCGRGCLGRFEHAPRRYAAPGRQTP